MKIGQQIRNLSLNKNIFNWLQISEDDIDDRNEIYNIIEEKIIGENTNLPADDDSSKYYLKELSKY